MKKISIFFLVLFSFLIISENSFSQNSENHIISGLVTDSLTNEPIAFATVRVTEKQSLKIVKAVVADENGKFSLTITANGDFLLAIDFVGKKRKNLEFSISENDKNIDLGKIEVTDESTQLTEVQVVAAAPLVKTEIDRLSYDTQADPDSKSSNVLDMLRKVPLVTVDADDKIQIKGGTNYKIYLNGKPSSMIASNPSQVLKSMPASSIKKIEVITDPGAKYDAEGVSAILNIVTEKSFGGYTGSVNASIDNLGSYGLGGYFSTKIGKFGITANFYHNKGYDYGSTSFTTQENLNSDVVVNSYRFMRQDTKGERSAYKWNWGSLEASYEIDSLNLISISAGGYGGNWTNNNTRGTTSMYKNDWKETAISGYNTVSNNKWISGGFSMNANYQRSFHKKDRLLTFSYQFDHSPSSSNNKIVTQNDTTASGSQFNPPPSDRQINSSGTSDEHTFQLDFVEPISKKHVVESGVKYILRLNNSDNEYRTRQNADEIYQNDTTQTSARQMRYTQNVFGAYGSYTFKLEKFSARAGLRLEKTSSDVKFIDKPENNFTPKSYFSVVPSVVFSYKTTDASTFKLSYNQSISRPMIWYLNPFIDNSDATNISRGNPNLKPDLSNTFSFSYGLFTQKFNLNASLFSSFTNNSIEEMSILQQNTDGKVTILTTYENIGKNSRSGGSLYFSWNPTTKFRINTNSGLYYVYFNTNDAQQSFKNDGWVYSFYGGLSYTFPLEIKFGLDAGYWSPWIALQGKGFAWSFSAASLSKDFFKKKLTVSLRLRGVFQGIQTRKNDFKQENQYYRHYESQRKDRSVSLRLTYTFGEMKAEIKKVQRTISNDDVKSGGGGGSQGGGQQ